MRDRFDRSDGLGAIYPPMVWSIVALKCLGYPDDSPEVQYCHQRTAEAWRSTTSDRHDAAPALQVAGLGHGDCRSGPGGRAACGRTIPPCARPSGWLLDRQIDRRGDWAETVAAEPGGWCFEYANDFYPDCDDTAMVLMALQTQFAGPAGATSPAARAAAGRAHRRRRAPTRRTMPRDDSAPPSWRTPLSAIDRGLRWLLAMQNRDGGWGAFDRNNDREFLCHVPFADHNAMIDPSTPDLAGRVLEALGQLGRRAGRSGRGSGRGLRPPHARTPTEAGSAAGASTTSTAPGRPSPGWRPSACRPTIRPWRPGPTGCWSISSRAAAGANRPTATSRPHLRGQGPPTASQTAWALLGLMAAGLERHPAVARGVRYLLAMQNDDGTWDEPEFTGTGFPRVFYLRYHYYPIYFPLLALSQWAVKV